MSTIRPPSAAHMANEISIPSPCGGGRRFCPPATGPVAPGLSAVLTNATRRDYFPSQRRVADAAQIFRIVRGGGDEAQPRGPVRDRGRADGLGEVALAERALAGGHRVVGIADH